MSDKAAARARKRKAAVLTNKLATLEHEPTLNSAEQKTAIYAALSRLSPSEIVRAAQPFKERFWQALTPELNIQDFLLTVPTDELAAALATDAPETLKREQETYLEYKREKWKLEAEIYKLAALYMRLNVPVCIKTMGWSTFLKITKISKSGGVELEDGRHFRKVQGLGCPRPFLTLGSSNLLFENGYAWHHAIEVYFTDVVLAIILSYHNSL